MNLADIMPPTIQLGDLTIAAQRLRSFSRAVE